MTAKNVKRIIERYATKYRLDAEGAEPTDENIAKVLEHCARRPKPEWYAAIRESVLRAS